MRLSWLCLCSPIRVTGKITSQSTLAIFGRFLLICQVSLLKPEIRRSFAVLLLLALPTIALGQAPVSIEGIPPHTAQIPVPLGFVNATNGHLHLEIPIASFPERNGDPLVAKLVYD